MIAYPLPIPFWVKWLVIGAVILGLIGTCLWYRGQALSAQQDVIKLSADLKLASRAIESQNAAVKRMDQEAEEAKKKAAKAQAEAAAAVARSKRSADALAAALAGPRPNTACPPADALEVVREDLRSTLR